MAKWIIDRTINLDYPKTKRVLELLLVEPRKDDSELERILMSEGVLKAGSDGALRRRWYTYLRNYGFLSENEVTEIGKMYANGCFSLQEIALLQLFKRKLRFDTGETIVPFKIVVGLFDRLLNNEGIDNAHITQSEFSNFIVNMKSDDTDEIQNVYNKIIQGRENEELEIVAGEHTDIWFNNIKQTGVFQTYGRSLFLEENKVELFNKIVDAYDSDNYGNFMRFDSSLIKNIPALKLKQDFALAVSNNSVNMVYDYLIDGLSINKLTEKYFRSSNKDQVIESLGKLGIEVTEENRGIYSAYKDYLGILAQTLQQREEPYKTIGKLIERNIKAEEFVEESTQIVENLEQLTLEEKIINKYNELNLDEQIPEIDELYKTFRERFSPSVLMTIQDKDLLKYMFYSEEKTNDSMAWWLECHPKIKEYFGAINGGSAFLFGLFYHNERKTWVAGTSQNPIELTEEQALQEAKKIRDMLVKAVELVERYQNINAIEEYEVLGKQLNETMGRFADRIWVHKYFHMLFPKMFITFYNESWQKYLLNRCGIMPKQTPYARNGQLALICKKVSLMPALVSKVLFAMFGYPKQVYKVGTSIDSFNYFEEWEKNNYIGIGWPLVGSLTDYEKKKNVLDKDKLASSLRENYYQENRSVASRKAGEIINFYEADKQSSLFVAMNGYKILGIAEIDGEYEFRENEELSHCKKVKWLKVLKGKECVLPIPEGKLTTCYELENDENLQYIYSLLDEDMVVNDDEIIEEKEEKKSMVIRTPRTNKIHPLNAIVYGAPGTGKTYSMKEYSVAIIEGRKVRNEQLSAEERQALSNQYKELVENGQIVFTTFHQSYGYEDFIQGLRPESKNGAMDFVPMDGVFKRIADRAMQDTTNNYVIIIDEINRGNISKVFGELITLIEDDKRWGEKEQLSVILPSGQEFAVPNNLYIVGTMNSADKSIALIDTALRRRFDFIEVAPNEELIADETLKKVLVQLNSVLRKQLESSDLLVGHAYFIGREKSDLATILNRNIIPLLYEYYYDNEKKVKDALAKAIEGTDVEIVETIHGRIRVK